MALDASQNLEDAELLARFSKGDRTAAQVLTARLAPLVFAQAFRMLGDRAEAEDVTQDSLLRLWHAAPDWQPGQAKVTTWLYRVTSNLCIDRMRKSKRHSGEEVPDMPDERPDIERRLQDRARAQALRAALGLQQSTWVCRWVRASLAWSAPRRNRRWWRAMVRKPFYSAIKAFDLRF